MPLSFSLHEIIAIGVDADFLDIDDAINAAVTNIRCFVFIGTLRNHLWVCLAMRHATNYIFGHQQRIPLIPLLSSKLQWTSSWGSDYYEEENSHAVRIKDSWDALTDYRLWQLLHLRTEQHALQCEISCKCYRYFQSSCRKKAKIEMFSNNANKCHNMRTAAGGFRSGLLQSFRKCALQ